MVGGVRQTRQLRRRGGGDLGHRTVEQHQRHVARAREERQVATVGDDRPTLAAITEIVDHDFVQPADRLVDATGAQKEPTRNDLIDHLFAQRERRLGASDVGLQNAQAVIRSRQDVVVEIHHRDGEHSRTAKHRSKDATHRHAARFERCDFALGCQSAERVQHRNEHGHRQRHRHGKRDCETEKLRDDRRRQPLAHKVSESLRDEVQEQQRRQRRQRKGERTKMLAEDVATEKLHGAGSGRCSRIRSGRIFDGPGARFKLSVTTPEWRRRNARLSAQGIVANPRNTVRYCCGLRLALSRNPSHSIRDATPATLH